MFADLPKKKHKIYENLFLVKIKQLIFLEAKFASETINSSFLCAVDDTVTKILKGISRISKADII